MTIGDPRSTPIFLAERGMVLVLPEPGFAIAFAGSLALLTVLARRRAC